jgi:hypothetical protein
MIAPLPGRSVLSVTPYPYIPGGYVVPFADGLIVYVVQPRRRVIGMLDMTGRMMVWLFGCRRLPVRYERSDARFYAFVLLACSLLSFHLHQQPPW